MENRPKTWVYLKDMQAVLIETKIKVQDAFIGDTIYVFKREYYRKRNNKTCYVDYKGKYFITDWTKIKKKVTNKTFSTGDNDWRPLHTTSTKYNFAVGYKEELINNFLKTN